MLTPKDVCEMMNKVYDVLKTMTIEQIQEAAKLALIEMPEDQAELFQHQCQFAIKKKREGKW